MFLKFFLFTLILHVVVQVSCVEPQKVLSKQETIAESESDTKSEQKVDESATENSEITLTLNGSDILPTTIIVSDLPTSALLSEAEESASELEEVTVATTALDGGSYTNETAAESDSETTTTNLPTANTEPAHETVTGDLSEAITDPVNGTVAVDSTENNANASGETLKTEETTISESDVTDGDMVTNSTTTPTTEFPATPTNSTSPTTTESPDTSTNSTTTPELPATPTPTSTSTTTSTTTETPTTPIDILCPQVNEDPKYRNETFDLKLAEFMKKNPLAKVYKSPGFPDPYAENLNCTLSVTLTNCTGIDIVVHYLDLDPFEHDSLRIRAGDENDTDEVGKELTGQKFGISLKIIHSTSLYVQFESGSHGAGVYRGFLLTYSPYGNDTIPPTTTEAPITVPPSRVEFYQVQLVLPKINRENTTWERFKDVLAGSASKYVTEVNLNYTLAHPDNVTINVYDCPDNWPNYENCVQLRFSITLWNKAYDPSIHYDLSIFEYELSTNSLSNMWDLYGRYDFLDILQVEEYSIPDGTYIFLLWTGISLTIVVIFIGVLYSIWRIDIFREYRRMHSRSDDQQDILKSKSELDISMYPIPHQPYPTLFETTEMNSGGYYDSHETSSTTFHQGHSFQDGLTNYRHSINTPFTPNIMDFNDTQLFPDDEENFGRVQPLSPRSQQKLLVLGAKRDESNT